MNNIVDTWINEVRVINNKSLAEGVRDMGKDLDVKFIPNHVYDWKAGRRPLPPIVFNYMMKAVLLNLVIDTREMIAVDQSSYIFKRTTMPNRVVN